MVLITTRSKILKIGSKFPDMEKTDYWKKRTAQLDALKRLDLNTATKSQVDDLIGNRSWTTLYCAECGEEVDAVMQLGEPPDYESSTTEICHECLGKAIKLIEGVIMVAK